MEIYKNIHCEKNIISFDDIYRKYHSQIVAYFVKRTGNQKDAEDLASEVFLYCYKNYSKYDSSKSSVSTWIYLIAKSRFYNYCRDRKTCEDIDDYANIIEDSTDFTEKAIYLEEMRIQLNESLKLLTERQRKIVILKYFEGMKAEEIALLFDTTANNIRVQLSKALKKMKKNMENWS